MTDLGDTKQNQIIAARLSQQGILLSNDVEPSICFSSTAHEWLNQVLQNESSPTSHHNLNATIQSFVEGALVGGHYDTYDADLEGINNEMNHHISTISMELILRKLEELSIRIFHHSLGLLKRSHKKKIKLDRKQYIAYEYEIMAYSFLFRLLVVDKEDRHLIGRSLHDMNTEKKHP